MFAFLRYKQLFKTFLPMKHFTPESFKPREQTLDIIRQYAYTYSGLTKSLARPRNNSNQAPCLN